MRGSLGAFALFKIFFVAGPKESAKTGVGHGDVVALGIIFDEELPVEIAVQGASRSQWLHFGKSVMTRLVEFFRHEFGHALPVPGKAHEEETHPLFEIEFGESHFGLLEARKAFLLGNPFQLAVEPVAPAVIGTNDLARTVPRLASHHPGSSVAANVVEGAEHAVPAPYHEDSLTHEVHGQVVARPRYVAGMAYHQPVAPEDALLLEFKELGVVIDPSGQGCAFFGLQILRPTRGRSRRETRRGSGEFGGEDASQKTPTRPPRPFEVEGPAVTQQRFGQ